MARDTHRAMASRSTSGHSAAVSSGSITRPARPHDSAKSRRRWISARRSGVRASSRLPTGFRHHRPSSVRDRAFSTVYRGEFGHRLRRIGLEDDPGRVRGGPAGLVQRPLFDDRHVRPAAQDQLVRQRAADDPGSDDHDARCPHGVGQDTGVRSRLALRDARREGGIDHLYSRRTLLPWERTRPGGG